ncbi:MAG: Clp protease [Okeania sp. SIO3I5]|uniref:caspase, EACC1-associated type n=1 Tax=Okeania sp. SIO3I5 TaxID=2607805 RepID=UPI0013BC004D|nr:GUN4 domain-containing protein [Okeania sp. SIO3I5]NEQ39873.1 Clp protease [Okeania sp. SIO3I5]
MAKIALLIGVSEYLPEFPALPSAVKDVEAMKEVLGNSEMGGFDHIKELKNYNRQEIELAIYELFANRNKDDVLLLYFSGHGVKSREGNLFLATPKTRKDTRGIVKRTAVAASVLQDEMNDSFSQRLVVILDCCYSGAFTKGMTAKGDENIDIQAELGGKGRAILMSSSAVQSSFESEGSELSIYTKYLVEGIKTGAADTDNNGKISADELHQYVSQKVHEESPAMTPQFAPVKEGYRIYLASSPQDEPKLPYRRKVQEILQKNNGKIDFLSRFLLEELCKRYGISDEEAKAIEAEEMAPYIQFHKKLKRYEEIFSQAVENSFPFIEKERETLQEIQSLLGLRDEDIAAIEERFLPLPQSLESKSENCAVEEIIKNGSQNNNIELLSDKNDEDITDIEERFLPKSSESKSENFAEEKVTENSFQNDEIELLSDKNVDYTKLRDFLANGEWKEADQETARCMFKVADLKEDNSLRAEDIENFPCKDLCTIDRLWVKYSNGKFGFSVQKEIYYNLGGKKEYNEEVWKEFAYKVGWRKGEKWLYYSDLKFDISTHYTGHLPSRVGWSKMWWFIGGVALFSRTETCGL